MSYSSTRRTPGWVKAATAVYWQDRSIPDYSAFCPAPGHGLGINDLKID